MSPTGVRVGIVVVAFLALTACAPEPVRPNEPRVVRELPLGPYDAHEQCLRLVVGDRLDFDWTASQPVSFNIHYRDGNAVIAPISRERVETDSGSFAPSLAHDYCLAWEAGPGGADLDYRLRLRPTPR